MCYYSFSIVSSPDSIFKVTELTLTKLPPWRLRQYVSPKLRHKLTILHVPSCSFTFLHVKKTSEAVIWASTLTKFIQHEHRQIFRNVGTNIVLGDAVFPIPFVLMALQAMFYATAISCYKLV